MKWLQAVLLPLSLSMGAVFSTGGYQNSIINFLNFEDSLIVVQEGVRSEEVPGVKGPAEGAEEEKTFAEFNLTYRYDSTTNKVFIEGRGNNIIIKVDDQKRPTKMVKGGETGAPHTTLFSYSENETTIEYYPNTPELTRHSTRWTYQFNDNGDTTALIKTVTDWEYGGEPFWATEKEDSLLYHYENGIRTALTKIDWEIDFTHSMPWSRTKDSLEYTYETLNEGSDNEITVTRLQQLSLFGDDWISKTDDTLYTEYRNSDGRIDSARIARWDYNNHQWDQQYFRMIRFEYEWDTLLVQESYIQHYGDGTKTVIAYETALEYGLNTLKYGDEPTATVTNPLMKSLTIRRNANTLQVHGTDTQFNRIALYSLQGRKLRSVTGKASISLDGLSSGQAVIAVVSHLGKTVATQKIIIR